MKPAAGEGGAALAAGGALLVGAAGWIAAVPGDPRQVLAASGLATAGYLIGLRAVMGRSPGPRWLAFILVAAALARAPLVLAPPVLEDDVHRYLWDGAVVAAGENPYLAAPQSVMDHRVGGAPADPRADHAARLERLAALSRSPAIEPAFLRINYPSVPTVYPPAAQLVFAAAARVAPGSIRGWKLVLLGAEALLAVALALALDALGRPRAWLLIYAWSPVVVLSFAGSAHMDVLAMLGAAAAVAFTLSGRRVAAGTALGVAVACKIYPLVLVPALLRRLRAPGVAALVATVAFVYAPFVASGAATGGLGIYAEVWQVNSAAFTVLDLLLSGLAARAVAGAAVLGIALWAARKATAGSDVVRAALIATAALVLLAPAVNPWYVAWLVPLLALSPAPALLLLSLTILLYPLHFVAGGPPGWLPIAEFAPPALVALASVGTRVLQVAWTVLQRGP